MTPVLRTTDLALAESVRVALEAEGIAAVNMHDGTGLPTAPVTVVITDDRHYDAARAVVDALVQRRPALVTPAPRRTWPAAAIALATIAAVLLVVLLR